jgi:hypothetical protein
MNTVSKFTELVSRGGGGRERERERDRERERKRATSRGAVRRLIKEKIGDT